jgi:hypothetical protein
MQDQKMTHSWAASAFWRDFDVQFKICRFRKSSSVFGFGSQDGTQKVSLGHPFLILSETDLYGVLVKFEKKI